MSRRRSTLADGCVELHSAEPSPGNAIVGISASADADPEIPPPTDFVP